MDIAFYSAITPLLPYYTDLLDLSKSEAGALTGAYAAGTLVAALPAGLLAARIGSRPTLLWGLLLLAAACMVFGFAESYELLVAARLLQGVGGAASWAAGMAWLLSSRRPSGAARSSGSRSGWRSWARSAGRCSARWPTRHAGAHLLGRGGAGGGLRGRRHAMPKPPRSESSRGLRSALRSRRVLAGAWLTTLPALFFGATTVLASLRLDALGVGAAGVAAVFLVSAGAEATLSPIVGRFSDRRGRLVPIRFGVTAMVAACVLIPVAEAEAWLLGAAIIVLLALVGGHVGPGDGADLRRRRAGRGWPRASRSASVRTPPASRPIDAPAEATKL